MIIKHESHISPQKQDLVEHGYGEVRLKYLKFYYQYTSDEQQANLKQSHMLGTNSPAWLEHCNKSAKLRSEYMERIMKTIGKKLPCFQYNIDSDELYGSPDWDLFFWCNTLENTTQGRLSGRDFDGLMLTFNELHSTERREQIYRTVMEALKDYAEDDHIVIHILEAASLDEEKIREDAEKISPKLIGKRVQYVVYNELFGLTSEPMDGRIVEVDDHLFFMKKRAKTRGYRLSNEDILQIYWRLKEKD